MTGASSLEPQFPEELKDSIHLYDVEIPPFTFNTNDVKIKLLIIEDLQWEILVEYKDV